MYGALGSPITVDWLWFSSMITKMRLTAALSPLRALWAATVVADESASMIARAIAERGSLCLFDTSGTSSG